MAGRIALVTGATGYTGSRLTTRLLRAGWAVHALVRPDGTQRCPAGAVAHVYDGTLSSVDECFETIASVDTIFHLASLTRGVHEPDDIDGLIQANIKLPLHLIESAANHRVPTFINTSTFWQHSSGTDEYQPFSLYAATKQAFEDLAALYVATGRIRFLSLILFDIYGPRDRRPKIIPLMIDAAAAGTSLGMSPGHQMLNLIHVDDVVSAYLRAAELPAPAIAVRERYVVRTPNDYSLRAVAGLIGEIVGQPVPIEWGARPYRPREIMQPWRGGTTVPGWTAAIGLREGLRQLCAERGMGAAKDS